MVKAWREKVVIPTYEIGVPEKNPIFLEKRVYQGSSGVVYPYPVIESIKDTPHDREWNAVWLENEYIKVMILPELGGRVQMAWDKVAKRHFVYYNHVIKPALVGLTGPWISGGIEFNCPQHHRPSTYLPIDSSIEENPDGSVTVWVSETEKMFHQKGMAGFTLRPGKAYLEIKGRLYNRTNVPQTFLWWANPAVHVNDAYQSVFPQDINAVFDHGKRAVVSFPIATGTYYKMDYSAGVDISNYRNLKVPTSYMGVNSRYNFEGGYENDTHGGMLHVANHHISPGKKQWTWGNGDFGQAWDRNLTDTDGPYIELMAGVYTENQPDFSWIMPYEEKQFTQYFMPYREVGVVKNASRDLILNIDAAQGGKSRVRVFATSLQNVEVVLRNDDGREYCRKSVTLSPSEVMDECVDTEGTEISRLKLEIYSNEGKLLLDWHAEPDEIRPIPSPAEAALRPEEIKTNDQLYLTGLHLEQYRHATYNPVDYYEEALRRDPLDYRCNNALGLWYIRKCRFEKAEGYLRTAVRVLQKRNPNPYDGEPVYNLGLALKYQGKTDEAYDMFYKSTWNAAWQDAGYFKCAEISVMQGRFDDAEEELEKSLIRNSHNHKARALKAALLRIRGHRDQAMLWCEKSLELDAFNYGCLFEQYLCSGDEKYLQKMNTLMHGMPNNYDELGLDYCAAGLFTEAGKVWKEAEKEGATTPMTYYFLAWAGEKDALEKAEKCSPDYCFPNRGEEAVALKGAIGSNADSAMASYYLGCLYYDKRQYDEAMRCWNRTAGLRPDFPTVWRNLALGYYNKLHDDDQAVECMEKAFSLDTSDARILMELDQLYKRLGRDHDARLKMLENYPALIESRDDLRLEEITLLNQCGRYSEAKQKVDSHKFHPWEGGEGKVSGQYQLCRLELAKIALREGENDKATELLEECLVYPHSLGEGKLYGAQENDFHYFLGCAYASNGNMEKAREYWERATLGPQKPVAAMYYNDAKPDKIFYQGLALRRLGRDAEANGRFYKLLNFGKNHLFDNVRMDYFAVSLPDLQIWEGDLNTANRVHCNYMLALGYCGLGDYPHASRYLEEASREDKNHLGILSFRTYFTNLLKKQ